MMLLLFYIFHTGCTKQIHRVLPRCPQAAAVSIHSQQSQSRATEFWEQMSKYIWGVQILFRHATFVPS